MHLVLNIFLHQRTFSKCRKLLSESGVHMPEVLQKKVADKGYDAILSRQLLCCWTHERQFLSRQVGPLVVEDGCGVVDMQGISESGQTAGSVGEYKDGGFGLNVCDSEDDGDGCSDSEGDGGCIKILRLI